MEILTFLMGSAFGLGIANAALVFDRIEHEGWSWEHVIDVLHETGIFVFLFALLNLYIEL